MPQVGWGACSAVDVGGVEVGELVGRQGQYPVLCAVSEEEQDVLRAVEVLPRVGPDGVEVGLGIVQDCFRSEEVLDWYEVSRSRLGGLSKEELGYPVVCDGQGDSFDAG